MTLERHFARGNEQRGGADRSRAPPELGLLFGAFGSQDEPRWRQQQGFQGVESSLNPKSSPGRRKLLGGILSFQVVDDVTRLRKPSRV